MKVIQSVCLDEELVKKARKAGLNISKTCNDALFYIVGIKTIDKTSEKKLDLEIEFAKKFQLTDNELYLIQDNWKKDSVMFFRNHREDFPAIPTLFKYIEVRKAYEELLNSLKGESK